MEADQSEHAVVGFRLGKIPQSVADCGGGVLRRRIPKRKGEITGEGFGLVPL